MLMLRVALRNVLRQKRRSILTVLTMLGGFALAATSIGFSDGTYYKVIDLFTRNQLGHIQIHAPGYLDRPSLYKTLSDFASMGAVVESTTGVEHWAPRIKAAGLASVGEKSTGVSILGIDPARENRATRFDKKIVHGRSFEAGSKGESIIGTGLARVLNAGVGDTVVIVSQGADGSIANDQYTIVGTSESGSGIQDQTTLYLSLEDAEELFSLAGRVHEIAVIVDELENVQPITDSLSAKLAAHNALVEPWQEFAKAFYRAMEIDRGGTWIMLGIVMFLVAVGVLNTVLMTVLERRREYGVLRAVGTAPAQVFRLVVIEVAAMALLAIVLGSLVAWPFNSWLAERGFSVGLEVTYGGIEFNRMYSQVNPRVFWIPGLCILLSAVIVSLIPAARAARTEPAQAMRQH
jgi:ABC-type lipoprotein release transport system permease subunit